MSLNEILAAIPKLSFSERQQLIRRTIELDDNDLTPTEKAILDERMKDFPSGSKSGVPAEQLKNTVLQRLTPR
jgi:hypothetical protein